MTWILIKENEHGIEERRFLCIEPTFSGVIQKRIVTDGIEVHIKSVKA